MKIFKFIRKLLGFLTDSKILKGTKAGKILDAGREAELWDKHKDEILRDVVTDPQNYH